MDKLILKLSRVNEDGEEETLCNEELRSVALIGECWDNKHKLMEVLAQTSVKNVALNIASSEKLIKAAELAVVAKKIFDITEDNVNEVEEALIDQIEEGLE